MIVKTMEEASVTQEDASPITSSDDSNKNSKMKTIILIVGVVLILGGGGFLFLRARGGGEVEPSPSPFALGAISSPEPTASPSIAKSEIKIKVLNGTGIAKEASYLQGILKELGYENVETGNAGSDRKAAQVSFSEKVPKALKDELLAKLNEVYTDVEESDSAPSGDFDIEIITGLRPGVSKPTPQPRATPPKASAQPSGSPSASGSPGPTPSPSTSPSPSP